MNTMRAPALCMQGLRGGCNGIFLNRNAQGPSGHHFRTAHHARQRASLGTVIGKALVQGLVLTPDVIVGTLLRLGKKVDVKTPVT